MASLHTCRLLSCPVNSGGECLEGFRDEAVAKCPNFGGTPDPTTTATSIPPNGQSQMSVPSGQALSAEEGNLIANAEPTRLVLLAGPVKSGKTTLLASLHEGFRKGPFGNCLFAGSKTLFGFEQICHLSRAASGLEEPDTERTKAGTDEVLLHLRIRPENGARPPLNLLLCDMTGELFEAANQSDDALLLVPFLKQASRVVVVLDGEKLMKSDVRQRVRQEAFTLLRGCIQLGRLHKRSIVDIVFSKQDLIRASEQRSTIEQFQNAVEEEASKRFAPSVGEMRFYRVSARPNPDAGFLQLFSAWVGENRPPELKRIYPPIGVLSREIDRFIWKGRSWTPSGSAA